MRIIFDPDDLDKKVGGELTKENRDKYLSDCNELMAGGSEIFLKDILKIMEEEIKLISNSSEIISTIFGSIDLEDTNYIGVVNIVGLQCVILLTENCFDSTNPFPVNLNNQYKYYSNMIKIKWYDYATMKKYLLYGDRYYTYHFKDLYTHDVTTTSIKYLTVFINNFKLDEYITSFLKKNIYCSIVSKFEYADGMLLTPFEYMVHDMIHGSNYNGLCFERSNIDIEDLKDFYNTCKSKGLSSSEFYKIKLMIFLLIHETLCDFFPYSNLKIKKENITEILNQKIKEFLDINDLSNTIPKEIRGNEVETKAYLDKAVDIYIRELKNWRSNSVESPPPESAPLVSLQSCKKGMCSIQGGRSRKIKSRRKKNRSKSRKR